jgi:release factor glutamine methyltransferase
MTVNLLYRLGVEKLKKHEVNDPEFDARCLLEYALGVDTTHFLLNRVTPVSELIIEKYNNLLSRRIVGEPLQYILGVWEFMGNSFYVGEGVLIPRPETESLVELAADYIENINSPVVIDLCSGSGCIAISLSKLYPHAKIFAVEKYDEAFSYLEKNIKLNSVDNVIPVKGDLFDNNLLKDVRADLILSNPPYIRKGDIESLSNEVRCEPETALIGGEDGYDYYRFLADYWLGVFLDFGTAMMVECAEDQGDYIAELFSVYSEKQKIVYDFNNLQRFVLAYK